MNRACEIFSPPGANRELELPPRWQRLHCPPCPRPGWMLPKATSAGILEGVDAGPAETVAIH